MKEQTQMILRLAVGAYLVYLAYQIISGQLSGGTGMNDLLAYGAGGVLGLCGLAFCGYALWRYRKERAARSEALTKEEP
ncbi:hypothetical protein [Subdoligranulum variabile]|uniref:Uncharacterized protein n=1 Tax=Subdoligranulum variabile DSM 15176 TaxID=411471 RepID=D1PSF5_9FIRM|nr:hypothetical protein [Subdoligranulum variabile]EFB74374.1 hypothetical protein SUBVAR_07338 [Subdoligranulum variabile DSM 15176]UWP69296.1 hypothetical protein NQ490_05430 [Subdoligranulum variabile]